MPILTIKDLSAQTGYSVGTISRVLNNQPNVSQKARDTILRAADECGFQLNANAKQLKQQHSNSILVLVKGTHNKVFALLVESIQDRIAETNYSLVVDYMDESDRIIRPANYAPQAPGRGWGIFDSCAGPVAVIDLQGRVNMDYTPDNPFLAIEKILKEVDTKLIFVELHAEATSEKLAMGYMLDGRVSALWGTHTHVPTADAQVLPKGTGYVTDLGMTGPRFSVLGIRPELSISRFRGNLPERYQWAKGPTKMEAVLFTIDTATGLCRKAERVDLADENTPQR